MKLQPFTALVVTSALLASVAACGKKKQDNGDDDEVATTVASSGAKASHVRAPGTPGRFNVAIIDDGFDLNQPLFDGRVLADYDIVCTEAEVASLHLADADTKAYFIEAYSKPDDSCRLKSGVSFEYSNELLAIEDRRENWNDGIRAKAINLNTDDAIAYRKVLGGYDQSVLYHGTNTSSLILYDNPDVRLVVFHLSLSGGSSLGLTDAECPTQQAIDEWVAANNDPDVVAAYTNRAPATVDLEIEGVLSEYGINLINASYGRMPRETEEQLLVSEGCAAVDLSAYYTTQAMLEQEHFDAHKAELPFTAQALTVQASGNDGVVVDDASDSLDCMPGTNTVLIGSHDIGGKRSVFSNYGACVPHLMLGENVVVGAPREFLDVADGTSFSAPLTVRYLSTVSENGDSAATMLAKLTAKTDNLKQLTEATFPLELAYSDPTPIGEFRLTNAPRSSDPRWLKARRELLRNLRPFRRPD